MRIVSRRYTSSVFLLLAGNFHGPVKRIMLDYLSMGGGIITFGISFYEIVEFVTDTA